MGNNPKISIIVPVYNAEKYLDGCIRSIYDQTFTDYEIILVNDGSTDQSAQICKRYRDADSRITYIEKENGGAGSARNAGMQAAKGRYLAFPDADDSFEPEMYEALYRLADSGDYDMVFSGVKYYRQTDGGVVYDREQNIEAVSFHSTEDCRRHIMTFFPTTTIFDVPWNKLYKRSVAVENQIVFPDIRRCQDATFNIDFFNCIQSAASLDQAYYRYMENTTADVQRKFPKDYIDIVVFYYTHLMGILRSWGVYGGEIQSHYDSTFTLAVYSCADRFDNPLWGLNKAEQRAYIEEILDRKEVADFLPDAQVREDVKPVYEILLKKDTDAVIRLHNKEKRKEKLRQNQLLMKLYRKLKG
ncbi:MAG: glycosyltransferase [Ruminococcus sp.]|nr:glycosyltransferase [Ruminococcus sp.]